MDQQRGAFALRKRTAVHDNGFLYTLHHVVGFVPLEPSKHHHHGRHWARHLLHVLLLLLLLPPLVLQGETPRSRGEEGCVTRRAANTYV